MKTLRILTIITFLFVGIAVLVQGDIALAQTPAEQANDGLEAIGGGSSPSFELTIETVINTFLYIIGALAVIMIIFGGFKYVTSSGDAPAVASAKNTILYAVIGVIVAILAYSIVGFVLDSLEENVPSSSNSSDLPPQPADGARPGDPF